MNKRNKHVHFIDLERQKGVYLLCKKYPIKCTDKKGIFTCTWLDDLSQSSFISFTKL